MKVIDLLNKIANDEELPKKIKIWGRIYYFCGNDSSGQCYFTEEEGFGGLSLKFNTSNMNEEVEIIEDKKIEKIKSLNNVGNCQNLTDFEVKQHLNNHILKDKINEIIEKINAGVDKE